MTNLTRERIPFSDMKTAKLIAAMTVIFLSCPLPSQGQSRYSLDVKARLEEGSKLLEAGQLPAARQHFTTCIQLEPRCKEAYNNLGLTFYRAGDLKKAAEAYNNAINIDPLFVPSISNLAAVRFRQRNLKEAAQLYQLGVQISRNADPQLQYNLANVLRDSKKYDQAEKYYKAAIKNKPDFASAYNGLGATYYIQRKFKLARRNVKKAISLKKDYSLAYYHLGLIESAAHNVDAAISAYKQSLKYERDKSYADDTKTKIRELEKRRSLPSKPAGHQIAGEIQRNGIVKLIKMKNYSRAESELARLVRGDYKNDPGVWNNLGFAQMRQDFPTKRKQSVKSFRKALALSGGKLVQGHYNLAQALRRDGDFKGAEKECKAAMEAAARQERLCPLVHNLYGILLKRRGQLNLADQEYKMAIAQSSDKLPVAHYNRALVLEKLRRSKDAVKEYKKYLKQAPYGLNAARARARLKRLGH